MLIAAALALLGGPSFRITAPSADMILTSFAITAVGTLAHLLIDVATVKASAALVSALAYAQLIMGGPGGRFSAIRPISRPSRALP